MEDHAHRQLAEVPTGDPFLHTVRSNLLAQLREGAPQLAKLTRQLHTTERTLRRRLQAAGTGYQQLLDEVRSQLAQEYMAQPDQDATTVAAHLGFTDPSTFYRAFKRWTGQTPAQYQRDRAPSIAER
jgi:AraC-like DNA-binding protein